jgi:hypothetical protein
MMPAAPWKSGALALRKAFRITASFTPRGPIFHITVGPYPNRQYGSWDRGPTGIECTYRRSLRGRCACFQPAA